MTGPEIPAPGTTGSDSAPSTYPPVHDLIGVMGTYADQIGRRAQAQTAALARVLHWRLAVLELFLAIITANAIIANHRLWALTPLAAALAVGSWIDVRESVRSGRLV